MSKKPEQEIERVKARVKKFRDMIKNIGLDCPKSGIHAMYLGDVGCGSCGEYEMRCELRKSAIRSLPISDPYLISISEYQMGKPWVSPYEGIDEIAVIDIFYVPVNKVKVDAYIKEIVKRLKDPILKTPEEIRLKENDRRELHNAICADAGFQPYETSLQSETFKFALETYVETRVKEILNGAPDMVNNISEG